MCLRNKGQKLIIRSFLANVLGIKMQSLATNYGILEEKFIRSTYVIFHEN
jgi:hypothetical protein